MQTQLHKVTSKLPNAKTTIFTTVGILAAKHKAVNLSQGFPDFDMDPKLIQLANSAMLKGHNQYAPMQGSYPLREIISKKIESLYGTKYHPDTEITITIGATQAIFTTITAFINPKMKSLSLSQLMTAMSPQLKSMVAFPYLFSYRERIIKLIGKILKTRLLQEQKW